VTYACGLTAAHFDRTGLMVASHDRIAKLFGLTLQFVYGFIDGWDGEECCRYYPEVEDNSEYEAGVRAGREAWDRASKLFLGGDHDRD
jgi:hypothetical protein